MVREFSCRNMGSDAGRHIPMAVHKQLFLLLNVLVTLLISTLVLGASTTKYFNYKDLTRGTRPFNPRSRPCNEIYSCRVSGDKIPGSALAPVNSSWEVNRDAGVFRYDDGSVVSPLLIHGNSGPSLACGFFCRDSCNATFFSIFLVVTDNSTITNRSSGFPQVVWSANHNKPVGNGSRLQLTVDGDLVLSNSSGGEVWSSSTAGKNVSNLILTETGNLVLRNSTGGVVWQSFDHVTDTVLEEQAAAGQMLVANASATGERFSINVRNDSFYAFIDSVEGQTKYFAAPIKGGILLPRSPSSENGRSTIVGIGAAYKFLRLENDGHLRLYEWSDHDSSWQEKEDRLTILIGEQFDHFDAKCIYPTVCGEYGICSDGQCSCPVNDTYFHAKYIRKPSSGCLLQAPTSCETQMTDILLPVENIAYFGYYAQPADLPGTDVQKCQEACLESCSCKAAFFKSRRADDSSKGDCYLPTKIFSMFEYRDNVSSAFLKVQISDPKRKSRVLGSVLGGTFALVLLGLLVGGVVLWRRRRAKDELEGYDLPSLPGMPSRFSYEELKSATWNFSRMLGEGGFGCVYYGTLADGESVAVKLLVGKRQGMKEFLAEVETIGSVHHVNLVRLVGYCVHKFQRLLVYEYMPNNSLDRWIFCRGDDGGDGKSRTLDWPTRQKIILQVAKGLTYLHEECRNRIAHLDIKPENILLDGSFNAKVSDFGLSKLISWDQSQVLTTMRGTPGYLAPEWLTSLITEKVDVYSFGVVVLETVCGRRNLGGVGSHSKPSSTLVNEAKSAAQEERLLEIVDGECKGVEFYAEEAIHMLRTALWCLQGDPDLRPSMSAVVKVLEGVATIGPLPGLVALETPSQVSEIYSNSSGTSTLQSASTLFEPR